jgi:hypothetical protein
MKKVQGLGLLLLIGAFLFSSCWFGSSDDYETVKGSIRMRSVKPGTGALQTALVPSRGGSGPILLDILPGNPSGGIQILEQAGIADSLTLTLKGVTFIMNGGDEVKSLDPATQNPIEISLTGDGSVATTIDLPVPLGTIEKVKLFFDPFAKIKGKIENKNYSDGTNDYTGISVQTKAQYYFDAQTGKLMDTKNTLDNRSDDTEVTTPPYYTFYQYTPPAQGPSPEEALLCLSKETYFHVETPLNQTIQEGGSPVITIAADLSRMLRFSIRGSELWPADTTVQTYQMFVANHYLNYLFAAYVGTSGTIQGYEYVYADQESGLDSSWARTGWMTLVFDGSGNLSYGVMVPDGQGGSPEGYLSEYQGSGSAISFKVTKDASTSFTINNFTKQSSLEGQGIADLAAPPSDTNSASSLVDGKVRFTLKMQWQ